MFEMGRWAFDSGLREENKNCKKKKGSRLVLYSHIIVPSAIEKSIYKAIFLGLPCVK
jgi:hypothetical protein